MIALAKHIINRGVSIRNPVFSLPRFAQVRRSVYEVRSFGFCTQKQSLRDHPQTFELMLEYLQERVDYVNQLQQTLIDETNRVNSNTNK
jgi:hypothetical protein